MPYPLMQKLCLPKTMPIFSPEASTGRYRVIPESMSNHCCFTATVVDCGRAIERQGDADPHMWDTDDVDNVCECMEVTDALCIAAALNGNTP